MLPVTGNRVLLIGAGGGFDIMTIQMIRDAILADNPQVKVETAGWLNPKFDHYYSSDGFKKVVSFEKAVNEVSEVVRFRRPKIDYDNPSHPGFDWYLKYGGQKPIVDTELRKVVKHRLWNFSTRFGLAPLIIFASEYNSIIVCDVGGDILYSGATDNEVRTPLIDAFSLALLAELFQVNKQSDCKVMLLGLGTDGELLASHIRTNLQIIKHNRGILDTFFLKQTHITSLQKYYEQVSNFTDGKTIPLLLAIWEATQEGNKVPIIGQRDVNSYSEWFNKVFIVSPDVVCHHNPLTPSQSFGEITKKAYVLGWKPR